LSESFKAIVKAIDTNGTLLNCNYAGNDVHNQKDVDGMAKALKKNVDKAAKAAAGAAAAKVDPDKPNNPAPLLQAKASAKPAVIARLELSPDAQHSLVVNDVPSGAASAPAPAAVPTPAPAAAVAAAPAAKVVSSPAPVVAPAATPAPAQPAAIAVSAMNLWQLANCVTETRAARFQIAQLQIAGIDVLRQFVAGSGPFAALPRIAALASTGTPVPAQMVAEIESFLQAATVETAGALHVLSGVASGTDLRSPQEVMTTCFTIAQERASIGQMTDIASQAVSQSLAACVNAFGGAPVPGMLDGNILVEELRRALTNERAHSTKSDAMVRDVQAALRSIQRDLAAAATKARSLTTNQ
jgi:hypothetical protein